MNFNSIPIIYDKTFIRKEKEGSIVIPNDKSFNDIIVINDTGLDILNLCNSTNTVNDIINILEIKYKDDRKKISNDVVNFIATMRKNNIIFCDLEDIMYLGKDIFLDKNYNIHRCGEGNINDIINLQKNKEKLFFVNNKIARYNVIQDVILKMYIRDKIFKFKQEYYILENNNKEAVALIIFSNKKNKFIEYYELLLLNIYEDIDIGLIEKFVELSIKNLKDDVCKTLRKVSAYIESNNDYTKRNEEFLLKLNFEKNGLMKDAFGINVDKLIYERIIE